MKPEKFEKFLTNLSQAMDNTITRISTRDLEDDFIYLNFDAVSYVEIYNDFDR